jgi:hypothetical protein
MILTGGDGPTVITEVRCLALLGCIGAEMPI